MPRPFIFALSRLKLLYWPDPFRQPLFQTELKSASSGSATWRSTLDGVERVFGYARLERYPLIVTAGYDRDRLRMEWMTANLTNVLLNIVLLLTITGMGVFVLRQVGTNVRQSN
ncbi:hypothetical protein LZ023_38770 (plasmid) [Pseudomonas silvicola]|nr:hypothetical protein LZ023_38770 [Pseudomonas silvicola]